MAYKIKHKCDLCSNKSNNTVVYKGKELCKSCYRRTMIKCLSLNSVHKRKTIEQALNKIYEIRGYGIKRNGRGFIRAVCSFPAILIGHKVKLVLIDNIK